MNIPIQLERKVRVKHDGSVYIITEAEAQQFGLKEGQELTDDEYRQSILVGLHLEMWRIIATRN